MRRWIVAVIGDSKLDENDEKYRLAEKLGRALISNGYRIVTGGLGGCMKAVSKGARSSPEYVEGDVIGIIPGFDPSEANDFIDVPIVTGMNYARNCIIANSDAVVAIGGGAGTLSEMALAWDMRRLVIGYKVSGWSGQLADCKIDHRIRYPDIPEDRVYGVSSEEEVLNILEYLDKYNKRTKGIKSRE